VADVEYDRVWKRFTSQTAAAVQGLSLQVPDRELLVMLGPSGCGKTTALRMLAGLEEPDDGDIRIGGKSVVGLEPKDRDIALVFQSYALYPHLSAHDNIGYPLKVRNLSKTEQEARIDRVAAMLAIGHLLPRRPGQLSGGEQQRVALARAIVREPRVFLMDEPLSNLDAKLRVHTRTELKTLQRELGTTMIFVTHDQAEALILSDRVVVMEAGRVEQIGRPEEVYRRPATAFVARFLGRANFLPGTVATIGATGIVVALDGGRLSVVAASRPDLVSGQPVSVVVRQESIRLEPAGAEAAGPNRFAATIVFHAFAGQAHHYVIQLGDGRELEVAAPGATPPLARGSGTHVAWSPEDVILLPGGAR